MNQLNIRVTHSFEAALEELMRRRGLKSKSQAVRLAIAEALEREAGIRETPDFRSWIGLALVGPVNPAPRFTSDDDLWR